ncbi:hypothetical protein [Mangrovihabitans endophyticus]|uniref:Uncharacterized protein n=1 Tax=Mangrovihabitans endophyticus TaxID=1751298 RepID=A0A8J3C2B0_9ACTN|nr:hypothetical protein [Mangrovihabitans endophyticus]GGK99746.1 hypothetical protein GCM10012284_37680 [Mangrovihabitans endophyticus]
MKTTRASAIAGFTVVALVALAVAVWQMHPWRESAAWVPTCSDLTTAMQGAAGGAWTVSKPDAGRDKNDTSTVCQIAFITTGRRHTGTVDVFIAGTPDPDTTGRQAATADCAGTPAPAPAPAGYLVYRACTRNAGDRINETVIAARQRRWATLSLSAAIPADGNPAEVSRFAHTAAGKLADLGLTLPEDR